METRISGDKPHAPLGLTVLTFQVVQLYPGWVRTYWEGPSSQKPTWGVRTRAFFAFHLSFWNTSLHLRAPFRDIRTKSLNCHLLSLKFSFPHHSGQEGGGEGIFLLSLHHILLVLTSPSVVMSSILLVGALTHWREDINYLENSLKTIASLLSCSTITFLCQELEMPLLFALRTFFMF